MLSTARRGSLTTVFCRALSVTTSSECKKANTGQYETGSYTTTTTTTTT
jgi:hypothetical protein